MPDTGSDRDGERRNRSLVRMLLWSSVDLDSRGLSPDTLGIAAGVAFASAMAVLYLVGESWAALRMVQIFTIVTGLAVGVAGTYDVLTKRPIQLLVPLAHVLFVVLALTLALRLGGFRAPSRAALAWSLGLHLCLLPLTTRLWVIFFSERANGRDVARRRRLLAAAEGGERDTLLVRILETEPGFSEAKLIGGDASGVIRIATGFLSPRPRPGLVYVLGGAVVINRSVPGAEEHGEWARYVIRVQDSVLLGNRPVVTEPAESAELATRAIIVALAISATLTTLSLVAAL